MSAFAPRRHPWRLAILALLVLILVAGALGSGRVHGQGEAGTDGGSALVQGEDGCWYHADGALASCEEVAQAPSADGGLIPGTDGCLYYPGGGLAGCPVGSTPVDGGCTTLPDGLPGCVVPGPISAVSEGPDPNRPLGDQSQNATVEQPAVPPDDAAAQDVPAFDPTLAADRLRAALPLVGAWLAGLLGWLA